MRPLGNQDTCEVIVELRYAQYAEHWRSGQSEPETLPRCCEHEQCGTDQC